MMMNENVAIDLSILPMLALPWKFRWQHSAKPIRPEIECK